MGKNSQRMESRAMCATKKCFCFKDGRIAEKGEE